MGYRTPAERLLTAKRIPEYRAERHPTRFKSCSQVNQIFLKADGKISCSCMRYHDILGDAWSLDVGKFINGELMRYIRESFISGYEPFAICSGCASRVSAGGTLEQTTSATTLHVEPSSQCNLFCDVCTCTFERLSDNPPPRANLDFATYEKVLHDIQSAKIDLLTIALVGFGEPLFNSRTHDMAALGRALFPTAHIYLDTNGNFGTRRADELADCGINEIRLGLDGVDQASYEGYRKKGNFAKALAFAERLTAAIRHKRSKTIPIWKYILFSHNDRDEQIEAAIRMAARSASALTSTTRLARSHRNARLLSLRP